MCHFEADNKKYLEYILDSETETETVIKQVGFTQMLSDVQQCPAAVCLQPPSNTHRHDETTHT